jgi:hypothetical protein
MSPSKDLEPVLGFLRELARNNNRPWFEAHRPAYEDAKGLFEDFVDELILGLGAIEDMRGVTARDCVMRIYRDIRFSKDKTPYKTGMGASIGPGGKKSTIPLLPAPPAWDVSMVRAACRAGNPRSTGSRPSVQPQTVQRSWLTSGSGASSGIGDEQDRSAGYDLSIRRSSCCA